MSRELEQIDRRIADTLEEIRILRAEGAASHERSEARWAEARARDEEVFAELRAARAAAEHRDEELFAELRALRWTSDLQTQELRLRSAELRTVSDTNRIQTDALRALLERDR